MKRDWDLVRLLMLELESESPVDKARFKADISRYPTETVVEHMALLVEKGYLEGEVIRCRDARNDSVLVNRITWEGHDLLAAMRNEKIWKQVTGAVKETAGSVTVDVLKSLLQRALMAAIESTFRQ